MHTIKNGKKCSQCEGKGSVYAYILNISGVLGKGILCKKCYNAVGGTILTYEITDENIGRIEQSFSKKERISYEG
jgi:hypothetical protein